MLPKKIKLPLSRVRYITLLILSLSTLSGCQNLVSLKIEDQDKQLIFNFNSTDEDNNSNRQVILYDIAVSRNTCESESCVQWEIIREAAYYNNLEFPLINNIVRYGSKPDGMRTMTTPQRLLTGEYNVVAHIGVIEGDAIEESLKIFKKFNLRVTENRNLYIKPVK